MYLNLVYVFIERSMDLKWSVALKGLTGAILLGVGVMDSSGYVSVDEHFIAELQSCTVKLNSMSAMCIS